MDSSRSEGMLRGQLALLGNAMLPNSGRLTEQGMGPGFSQCHWLVTSVSYPLASHFILSVSASRTGQGFYRFSVEIILYVQLHVQLLCIYKVWLKNCMDIPHILIYLLPRHDFKWLLNIQLNGLLKLFRFLLIFRYYKKYCDEHF